jgi:hypothetical protein
MKESIVGSNIKNGCMCSLNNATTLWKTGVMRNYI